jgi:nucleoid-associated protein YgaU
MKNNPYSNACTRKRRKRNLAAILLIGLLITIAVSCGNANRPPVPGHMVTETYIVQSGDVLWTIAAKYMDKNTYGPREIREFYSGIIELNYDDVFVGREPGLVLPGDRLKINYWVRE